MGRTAVFIDGAYLDFFARAQFAGWRVLVAGDSDFVPALVAAKDEGVVCILHHGPDAHHELRQVADECHRLDTTFLESVRRN